MYIVRNGPYRKVFENKQELIEYLKDNYYPNTFVLEDDGLGNIREVPREIIEEWLISQYKKEEENKEKQEKQEKKLENSNVEQPVVQREVHHYIYQDPEYKKVIYESPYYKHYKSNILSHIIILIVSLVLIGLLVSIYLLIPKLLEKIAISG